MPKCRITVLKKLFLEDVASEYRNPKAWFGSCPFFEEGQTFVCDDVSDRPLEFPCDWAWNDIHKVVLGICTDADYGRWMKNPKSWVACCTDGVKPVVFRLEAVDDSAC